MLTMFGVIFTVIALVALIALVLVRSKAQYSNQPSATQNLSANATAPTITSFSATQGGPELSYTNLAIPDKITLTAHAAASTPVTYTIGVHSDNGVVGVLNTVNATYRVTMTALTAGHDDAEFYSGCPTNDANINGTNCYTAVVLGNSSGFVAASASANETEGTATIEISPQYYARYQDAYRIFVSIVDENSQQVTASNRSIGVNSCIYGQADATVEYGSTTPLTATAPVITNIGQGCNYAAISDLKGSNWTCTQGTMLVGVTQYEGTISTSWTYGDLAGPAVELTGAFGTALLEAGTANPLLMTLSSGAADGSGVTDGKVRFTSLVKPTAGVSGACTATMYSLLHS